MKQRVLSTVFALCLCISAMPNASAWQASLPPQAHAFSAEFAGSPIPYADVNLDVPTPQEAYVAMIAL